MVGRQKAMDFRSATVRNGEFLDFLPETELDGRNHEKPFCQSFYLLYCSSSTYYQLPNFVSYLESIFIDKVKEKKQIQFAI